MWFFLLPVAFATDYDVPSASYATVTSALGVASDGDSILLDPTVGPIPVASRITNDVTIRSAVPGTPVMVSATGGNDGAFHIDNAAVVTIQDVEIDGALTNRGIRLDNGLLTLIDVTIRNGSGSTDGGAIRGEVNNQNVLYATRLTIEDSVSGFGDGGGIWFGNGTLTLTDSTFRANESMGSGGAIAVVTASTPGVLITDTLFEQNITGAGTGHNGGALWVDQADLGVVGGTFRANEAGDGGGAIYTTNRQKDAEITGTAFVDNVAQGNGGALYIRNRDNLDVIRATFTGNRNGAGSIGASALYAAGPASTSVSESVFVDNESFASAGTYAGVGGAVVQSGDAEYIHNVFCDNRTEGRGGALHVAAGVISVAQHLFLDNQSDDVGGAIYVGAGATVNIVHVTAAHNAAQTVDHFLRADGDVGLTDSYIAHHGQGANAVGGLLPGEVTLFSTNAWFGNGGRWGGSIDEFGVQLLPAVESVVGPVISGTCVPSAWVVQDASELDDAASDGTDIGAFGFFFSGWPDNDPSNGVLDVLECAGVPKPFTELVSDGIDGNCDGLEDCYLDEDHDGFGTGVIVQSSDWSCLAKGFSDNPDDQCLNGDDRIDVAPKDGIPDCLQGVTTGITGTTGDTGDTGSTGDTGTTGTNGTTPNGTNGTTPPNGTNGVTNPEDTALPGGAGAAPKSACGCASGAAGGLWWLGGAALVLGRRRASAIAPSR